MFLTIGICTYHRSALLDILLQSIVTQVGEREEFEVIVNDDGGDLPTSAVLKKYKDKIGRLIVLNGHGKGLSEGRRSLLKTASGELLAFIDDDALLSPFWLSSLSEIYKEFSFKYDVFGGPVFPAFTGYVDVDLPVNSLEKLSALIECKRGQRTGVFPVGANFVVKTSEVKDFNFSSDLGRKGVSLDSNEETAYFRHVGKNKIGYFNSLSVLHCVEKGRLDPVWLDKRYYAEGKSFVRMLQLEDATFGKYFYMLKLVLLMCVGYGAPRKYRLSQFKGAIYALENS